jgi:two-component system cell cycle response regulator DivK
MNTLEDVSNWRVLIVDDEPDNLTLASEFLTFSGATVAITEHGAHLLEMVDEFDPSIILLDLAMPGMDGWEVQRRLRARPELSHIPIIALTALAMPEDADRVKMAGFDGYITKPFRVGLLLRDVKACVMAFIERYETPPLTGIREETRPESQEEPQKETVKEQINERTDTMENRPGR